MTAGTEITAAATAVHIARRLGEPAPIAPAGIGSRYHRHQHAYGQESTR